MRDLNYQLRSLAARNRDGSYQTQNDRKAILNLLANTIHRLGYRNLTPEGLRPKHVEACVAFWKDQGVSDRTIANRLTAFRWWAEKIDKRNVVKRENAEYGVTSGQRIPNAPRLPQATPEQVEEVTDPFIRASIGMAKAFGLRMKEAIMCRPVGGNAGLHFELRGAETKGARPRNISIETREQKDALLFAAEVVNNSRTARLIRPDMNYHQQRKRLEKALQALEMRNFHGHRRVMGMDFYDRHIQQLANQAGIAPWVCPFRGGPKQEELNAKQSAMDREVRLALSEQLGHGRIDIVAVYIGR